MKHERLVLVLDVSEAVDWEMILPIWQPISLVLSEASLGKQTAFQVQGRELGLCLHSESVDCRYEYVLRDHLPQAQVL